MKRMNASDTSKKTTAEKIRLHITRSGEKKYEKTNSTTRQAATIINLVDR